nr:zinc ribbon domain-containing protein [Candidatus Sigynarchaeota archaeon]
MSECPSCHRQNKLHSRFCAFCGQKLPQADKLACPSCQQPQPVGRRFCISCGARLPEIWSEPPQTPQATQGPQWKSDPDIVFCPSCNYGCSKSWGACPMCGVSLIAGDSDAITPEVPLIIDDGPIAYPKADHKALREKVKAILDDVVSNMGIMSLHELGTSVGTDTGAVSLIVKDLIAAREIQGYIEPSTQEFISEISTGTPERITTSSVVDEVAYQDLKESITKEEGTSIDNQVKEAVQALELKRGYEFEAGRVHYKITVRNNSRFVITDLRVHLDVPDVFSAGEDGSTQTISLLNPGESRGIDFHLDPLRCGTSEIGATVVFKDIYGKRHSKLVPVIEVQVKEPIVARVQSSFEKIQSLTNRLLTDMKSFIIKELGKEAVYNAAFRAVSRFDMSCVHDVKSDAGLDAWFSAESKVNKEPVVVKIVVTNDNILEIRVWCKDNKELAGLLAKIITNLRDEIEFIQRLQVEKKDLAIKLMTLGRNLETVKTYAMLTWEAGEICTLIQEARAILVSTLHGKEIDDLGKTMNDWCVRISSAGMIDHVSKETGEQLEIDVSTWQKLINVYLSKV